MQTPAPALSPVLEIPVDGFATGGFQYPQWTIDQSSGIVAITQFKEEFTFWSYVRYNAIDWLTLACVVVLPLLAWRIWRVARTPRLAGRLVCSACAYDLTPAPGATLTPICPECGARTDKRRPVLGTTRFRRLVLPVSAAVLLIALTAWVGWATLQPVAAFTGTRRWPSLVWEFCPAWMRYEHKKPSVVVSDRVDVWSIAERRVISSTTVSSPNWRARGEVRDIRLLVDGRYLGVTSERAEVRQRLVRVSDGAVLWEYIAPNNFAAVRCGGFAGASADGARVYAWRTERANDGSFWAVLTCIDTVQGSAIEAGRMSLPRDPDLWGATRVVALDEGGPVQWASVLQDGTVARVVWNGGGVQMPGSIWVDTARIERDPVSGGARVVAVDGNPAASTVWVVRMSDEKDTHEPCVTLGTTASTIAVTPAAGGAPIMLSSGDAVVALARPHEANPRWITAIGTRMHTPLGLSGTLSPTSGDGCVQVWDLCPVPNPVKP